MANASRILFKKIKDEDIQYVDLRFTDPRGKLQHVTVAAGEMGRERLRRGIAFDGSSIAGWKAIDECDMTLMPDPESAHMDPFFAQIDARDLLRHSRAVDRRALRARPARHRQEGRGLYAVRRHRRQAFFGPEAEFFIFDDVQLFVRPLQFRFQPRFLRASDEHGHRVRDGQSRPPAAG